LNTLPFSQFCVAKQISGDALQKRKQKVFTALMAIADALHKQVAVEGITNKHQSDVFQQLGCQAGSGSYFGQAINWDQLRLQYLMKVKTLDPNTSTFAPVIEH